MNSLFLKIVCTLLLLLLIVGGAYVYITASSVDIYFHETNQKLNANLAELIVKDMAKDSLPVFKSDGSINTDKIEKIANEAMAYNPLIEIYILDTHGKAVSYMPQEKSRTIPSVNLGKIEEFLEKRENNMIRGCITGEDPRTPGTRRVFSAAKFFDRTEHAGYVYVVLASQAFVSAKQDFFSSTVMRVGSRTVLLTFISAFTIGLLAFWYLTKNLSLIRRQVQRFRAGEMDARIKINDGGELTEVATSFNEMADTIVANIDELKNTEKLRRELIANVSHDLRTPLSVIHGYIETMQIKHDQLDAGERENYLQIILKSTERLEKLVSELFELSKLEAKQVKPHLEPLYVNELVQDTYKRYQVLAQEKGIRLQTDVPRQVSPVVADISLIERVLQNLLDNAFKFTPEGGTVAIAISEEAQQVSVNVSDSGSGIPDDEVDEIFDRFKSRNSKNYNSEGAGLGLAIVRKILELHNADIQLETKLEEGTTFSFSLPKLSS